MTGVHFEGRAPISDLAANQCPQKTLQSYSAHHTGHELTHSKMARGIKKRGATGGPVYATYIHKVLKQVHPKGITISGKGMEVVSALVEDLEGRLAAKAVEMAKFQKKSTLAAKHVQTAVKVLLPGEIAGHAISEGTKAITRFSAA